MVTDEGIIRRFDCVHYAECLDRAAKGGTALKCTAEKCRRYEKQMGDGPIDPFVEELKQKDGIVMKKSDVCRMPDCNDVARSRGLCHKHYDRWRNGKAEIIEVMGEKYVRKVAFKKRTYKVKLDGTAPDGPAGKPPERGDQAAETFEVQEGLVEVKEMVDGHWHYIEQLLRTHGQNVNIKVIEFHYKSAFVHGFKHGIEFRGLPEIAV